MTMTKTAFAAFLSMTFLCASVSYSLANELTNGDFSGGTAGTWQSGSLHGANTSVNNVPTGWTGFSTGDGALNVNSGPRINFNGANKPVGSHIEQTVATLEAGKWYDLNWTQAGHQTDMRITASAWNGTNTAATPAAQTTASSIGGTGNFSSHSTAPFVATGNVGTVRFSDAASGGTNSKDAHLYDTSLDLFTGSANIAPSMGTASAKDFHGSFGTVAQQAIDGNDTDYVSGGTNYHSATAGDAWWMVEFDKMHVFTRIEIQARTNFDNRNGDVIEFLDDDMNVVDTVSPVTDGSLFAVDGEWYAIKSIRISNGSGNPNTLNLAEVRTFAQVVDGVVTVVPEPSSFVLVAIGLVTLGFVALRRRRRR